MSKAMEEITQQVQRDEESGWLVAWWDDPSGWVASPRRGRTSATCSSKSRRRLPSTLMKAPLPVESAFISSVTLSWFRRESAPKHLGTGGRESVGSAGLLDRQADWFSCSHGPGESTFHRPHASQSGGWHTPEHSPTGRHHVGQVYEHALRATFVGLDLTDIFCAYMPGQNVGPSSTTKAEALKCFVQ